MEDFLAKWASGEISEKEKEAFRQSEDYHIYNSILEGIELLDVPDYNTDNHLLKLKIK